VGTADTTELQRNRAPAGRTESAEAPFPGLELLVRGREAVQALLCDGREISGVLTGFFASAAEVEITASRARRAHSLRKACSGLN
jgi:hypothetical protein